MNKLIIAAILSLGTSAAFAAAGGEVSRNDQVPSQKTRAQVIAETRAAVAAGLMQATAEGETVLTTAAWTGVPQRSRDEVRAEARQFRGANATLSVRSTYRGS